MKQKFHSAHRFHQREKVDLSLGDFQSLFQSLVESQSKCMHLLSYLDFLKLHALCQCLKVKILLILSLFRKDHPAATLYVQHINRLLEFFLLHLVLASQLLL